MRALNVLLSILISLLVAGGVLELGLRVLGKSAPKTLNQFDPQVGWAKRPNAQVTRSTPEYTIHIATNEHGLREDQGAPKLKAPGVFRILALGDSFTLGYSVERERSFVEVLERWLAAEGRKVEVINAGTEGYSTDQAVAWLGRYGAEWSPDLVLLFPYDNDWYWNGQDRYIGGLDKPRFASDGTLEARTLEPWPARGWLMRSALARFVGYGKPRDVAEHVFVPAGSKRAILKEFEVLFPDLGDPALTTPSALRAEHGTQGALSAFKAQLARLGARGAVVPIPSHAAVDPAYLATFAPRVLGVDSARVAPDRPLERVLALARERGLLAFDSRPALRAAGSDLYYKVDWHFTDKGNAAFAAFLHETLEREGLLEGAAAPSARLTAAPELPAAPRTGFPTWAKLFAVLWIALTALYIASYPKEKRALAPFKIAGMLALVFGIFLGAKQLIAILPPRFAGLVIPLFLVFVLGFVLYKLGRRLGTIAELMKSFTLRGHWYLMPLVMVLLSVGSLLVVAASSPLIAPFIYTLF